MTRGWHQFSIGVSTSGEPQASGTTDLIEGIKGKVQDPTNGIYWIGYNKFFGTMPPYNRTI